MKYVPNLSSVEYFGEIGGEKLLSGDEEKKPEGESDQEEIVMSTKKDARKAVSIQDTNSRSVPAAKHAQEMRCTL